MREDLVQFMAKLVEAQNMKNPSLGKLRSLCQINQLHKEENQERNLTWNNFAQPCKMPKRSASCRTENELCWRNFATPCKIFSRPFPLRKIHNLVKPKLKKMNFATLWNSPCVIFRYFLTDSVRFLSQDILCNYPFSPCNQLKIFFRYCNQLKIFFC